MYINRLLSLCGLALSAISLVSCGGGGGGSGSGDATTSYTVSTSVGANGSISPTSATVDENGTTSFTLTPDSGYSIGRITGCGGSLNGSIFTTGPITADCSVYVTFDVTPVVSVASASVVEGNIGANTLSFGISLSTQANGDVTVDYATGDGTATTADSDYTGASGTLTISGGTTSSTVSVSVNGDTNKENDEAFTLTLSNVSANASLGTASAAGTILNDDITGALNDTGITTCSNGSSNGLACPQSGYPGQDAEYGRDVSANDDSDGHAGFSFIKIDSSGNPLADSATSWSCVLDRVTGLMWEVKTNDGGLRDKDWIYSWYNTDSTTNGGNAGTANGGICVDSSNCDTEKYVAQVNNPSNGGICGYQDWRMPTAQELLTLTDLSVALPSPTIDIRWFPNVVVVYWSSSPHAVAGSNAWAIDFGTGNEGLSLKSGSYYVRLVRGE